MDHKQYFTELEAKLARQFGETELSDDVLEAMHDLTCNEGGEIGTLFYIFSFAFPAIVSYLLLNNVDAPMHIALGVSALVGVVCMVVATSWIRSLKIELAETCDELMQVKAYRDGEEINKIFKRTAPHVIESTANKPAANTSARNESARTKSARTKSARTQSARTKSARPKSA